MSSDELYRCCCRMARELLQGLETRDLAVIEKRLQPLRQALAARRCLSDTAFQPDNFLRLEQLELLEGITESIEASVEAIRRFSHPHWLRMQTAESLLRHVVDPAAARSSLPVC